MIPLDELEKLAKAATPDKLCGKHTIKLTIEHKPTLEYIAALSPDVVLSLIAEVRRLRKPENDLHRDWYEREIFQLSAQLEEARKALEIYVILDAEDKKIK